MSQYKDDYMCIFDETGGPLKLPGYVYTKDFDEIKSSCEAKYGGIGKFVRKKDWINPEDKYGCFKIELDYYGVPIRDQYGNFKKVLNDNKVPIKYHTRSECNRNKKDSSYMVNDPDKPIIKLDNFPTEDKATKSRTNILIFFYSTLVIVYLIWNLKFATKRPYYLYDYIEGSVILRIFLLLVVIGTVIIIFCPFGSCWLPRYASMYRKEPLNELYRDFCKLKPETVGCKKDNNVCTNHGDGFPGCGDDPDFKYIVDAPDPTKTCEDYGLPNNQCYFYIDPKTKKRMGYYYPYKYMNWVEQYNRLDYQLKDKDDDDVVEGSD